ncbi:MAG: SDR family NAD(P)-dependent oxidoreductase [Myxococcales bacterium]|jgi:NAD(P)-dependent dehydrogenase (short-subunit alcohol dehydrogenase family)|nr:SDR family NAD(P)-dependent oxidoreductase [Myxococcales bacterium]
MGLLEGKVAIVTGAGNGIGREHALLFAKEGAKVLVNDVGGARDGTPGDSAAESVVQEIRKAGGVALANVDTVATAEGAERIVDQAVSAFGHVDILVNNAGILRDKSLLKLEEDMWDAVVAVHLKGTFLCSQAFARRAVPRGEGGRIVNTTSVSGLLGNFGQASYAAAKAGIYGLTRTMSIELQKHRITVNALAPIAKTRMTEDLPMFQGMATMGPEHVAPAALFLSSDLCGARTGYVLAVAGARMYAFKVVETPGKFKEGESTVWTANEIADNWDAIVRA